MVQRSTVPFHTSTGERRLNYVSPTGKGCRGDATREKTTCNLFFCTPTHRHIYLYKHILVCPCSERMFVYVRAFFSSPTADEKSLYVMPLSSAVTIVCFSHLIRSLFPRSRNRRQTYLGE
ncbi:hypothetical protein, unlikely [Trypanosoma brucei gambiense DAL972]|uniref:Uncharacterized protein n=1 Tax=Trypanosoma brucei gambiense (strain MHOM/CI/86/DAL972) TaxID=679716 RepID=C9ZPJ5_TRYB9|nr:hypothetical protein, unlikely [Trypanosoma brucei gambiense DAL972]CBH11323.1 hypothetical protein, unlikely [Trypanosoma brucei gambiense DAL972]|eukprot:XP_011773610.1 hypothetical protein, unlikely [Trypanosoma brucei gambiense DAL972]